VTMRWFVVGALLALSSAAMVPGASASTKPRLSPNLIVLVVAGQSNALGYQSFVIDPKTHKDVFTDKGFARGPPRALHVPGPRGLGRWTPASVA